MRLFKNEIIIGLFIISMFVYYLFSWHPTKIYPKDYRAEWYKLLFYFITFIIMAWQFYERKRVSYSSFMKRLLKVAIGICLFNSVILIIKDCIPVSFNYLLEKGILNLFVVVCIISSIIYVHTKENIRFFKSIKKRDNGKIN